MRYHVCMEKKQLSNPRNVKFDDLLKICMKHFGNPRIKGSHHIFKTPWRGDPKNKYTKGRENG